MNLILGWGFCAFFALGLGAAIKWGVIPAKFQTIRRSDQPRLFWIGIGILGVCLLVLAGLGLVATFFPETVD